ncbi:Wadjet anti-phage system protein JetD domain-containing protein [Scrofimicrobium canadense]|uniref:Wadjet anti-phage system protein JetD domain-containing protein n=1 Tax=Scrofimicrobium canadense TaxID=2652290 RepID=UPI00197CCD93|nr:Wadjet anti-phage system protein JetD domain-containing protein [Scrofimicrobium canadense]
MSDPAKWTTPSQIASKIHRRWSDGTLLRAFVLQEPFPAFDISLRAPTAKDIGEHFDQARRWATVLQERSRLGTCYELEYGCVGGRDTGRSRLPRRAHVTSFTQAFRLLGVAEDATLFQDLFSSTLYEPARAWVLNHPLTTLRYAQVWEHIVAAAIWLESQRNSGRYLREIDAPGVDTKFVETHLSPIAGILGIPANRKRFESSLGLSSKPQMVRLRYAPHWSKMPGSEAILRVEELDQIPLRPQVVLIVENEVTYLSVPAVPGSVVLWGRGYGVDHPASLSWLRGAKVLYWGDIDLDGFAILNRTRHYLPRCQSVLMDRQTFVTHQDRWGRDVTPKPATLRHLTAEEQGFYSELRSGRFGAGARLEQERISWPWALDHLAAAGYRVEA